MLKRILAILLLFVTFSLGHAYAQRVTNGSYQTVAHIKSDGTIQMVLILSKGSGSSSGLSLSRTGRRF